MNGIIEKQFSIEIVDYKINNKHLTIDVAYSHKEYPTFYEFLAKRLKSREPLLFEIKEICIILVLKRFSFCGGITLPLSLLNQDITVSSQTYGCLAANLPVEQRKDFLKNYSYGRIDGEIVA